MRVSVTVSVFRKRCLAAPLHDEVLVIENVAHQCGVMKTRAFDRGHIVLAACRIFERFPRGLLAGKAGRGQHRLSHQVDASRLMPANLMASIVTALHGVANPVNLWRLLLVSSYSPWVEM